MRGISVAFITPGLRLRSAIHKKVPVLSDTGKPGLAAPAPCGVEAVVMESDIRTVARKTCGSCGP